MCVCKNERVDRLRASLNKNRENKAAKKFMRINILNAGSNSLVFLERNFHYPCFDKILYNIIKLCIIIISSTFIVDLTSINNTDQ